MIVPTNSSGRSQSSVISDEAIMEPTRTESFLLRIGGVPASWKYGFAAVWLLLVLIAMMGRAHQKPFWSDEVVFRWIALEPSVHAIYHDLLVPTDLDPPVAQIATHFAMMVFGSGVIGARVPSMIGVCSALLCLFLVLEMYVDSLFACIGLLFPLSSLLITYGWEARPYGLMYGFLALAVLSWCRLGEENSHRRLWTFLLTVSLVLMLGCHFYSVFALPAFFVAEFVRMRRRAHIEWATWLAILGASATELFYLPIMAAARKYSDGYFEKPDLDSLPAMFVHAFPNAGTLLFIFLVLAGAVLLASVLASASPTSGVPIVTHRSEPEFIALALVLTLIPVFGWLAGILFLKAFVTRYVLHGLIGLFLLLPFVSSRLSKGNPVVALLLIATFGCQGLLFVGHGISDLLKAPNPTVAPRISDTSLSDLAAIQSAVSQLHGDVVISDPRVLIEMANYSPELKSRCIYLADRDKELEINGKTTSAHMLSDLSRVHWVREAPWSAYRNSGFLLLTLNDAASDYGWLTTEMDRQHRRGPLVANAGKFVIVQVNPAP